MIYTGLLPFRFKTGTNMPLLPKIFPLSSSDGIFFYGIRDSSTLALESSWGRIWDGVGWVTSHTLFEWAKMKKKKKEKVNVTLCHCYYFWCKSFQLGPSSQIATFREHFPLILQREDNRPPPPWKIQDSPLTLTRDPKGSLSDWEQNRPILELKRF